MESGTNMNAYELADIVDHWAWSESAEYLTDAATMLRQQQAEIEALKETNLRFADLITEQRKLINEEIYNKAGIK